MTSSDQNSDLLLRLKSRFGNDLQDPALARIQEIEKATNRLQEIFFSREATANASPECLETRQFLIDTIERNLLLIPKDRYLDLIRFLRDLKTPSGSPSADPLDHVVAVTTKLEAFLKEALYDLINK